MASLLLISCSSELISEGHSASSVDKDGTIFVAEDDTWIQNQDGEVIASYANGDFDYICAYGDGYYALARDASSFDAASYEIGIIDIHGSWLVDYNAPTDSYRYSVNPGYFQYMAKDHHVTSDSSGDYTLMGYCGSGVFFYAMNDFSPSINIYATYHFISCSTQAEFTVEEVSYPYYLSSEIPIRNSDFSDDCPYITIQCKNGVVVIGLNGVIGEFGEGYGVSVSAVAPYSDGGIVYYQKAGSSYELRFFNCTTGQSVLICQDSDRIDKNQVPYYKFKNGQLDITLTGFNGQTYYATVDKQGNYIEKPHLKQSTTEGD